MSTLPKAIFTTHQILSVGRDSTGAENRSVVEIDGYVHRSDIRVDGKILSVLTVVVNALSSGDSVYSNSPMVGSTFVYLEERAPEWLLPGMTAEIPQEIDGVYIRLVPEETLP